MTQLDVLLFPSANLWKEFDEKLTGHLSDCYVAHSQLAPLDH